MTAIDTMRAALFGNPPSSIFKPSREGVLQAFDEAYDRVSGIVTRISNPDGSSIYVNVPPGATPATAYDYNKTIYNGSITGVYSDFTFYNQPNFTDGSNATIHGEIVRFDSITSGFATIAYKVLQTPLPPGSGLPGAPVAAQNFSMSLSEQNPHNRWGDGGFKPELRLNSNAVFSYLIAPETADFSNLLGGVRIGYNVPHAYMVAKSERCANYGGLFEHAKVYNPFYADPNSIATDGYFAFATGFKKYPNAIAINAAGTGYTVGNLVTLNTALDGTLNENTIIQVNAVNGGGGITAAEIYRSGSYTGTPPAPCGVTGGTGSGATFTLTLRAQVGTQPHAFAGVAGGWKWGLDFCAQSGRYSFLTEGAARFPSNTFVKWRNAGDTADISAIGVNGGDQVELAGKPVIPPATWSPTVTAETGSSTIVVNSARVSRVNGIIKASVAFQVTAIGTGAGEIRLTLPATPAYSFVGIGKSPSTATALMGYGASAGSYIGFAKADGSTALSNGAYYTVDFEFEV